MKLIIFIFLSLPCFSNTMMGGYIDIDHDPMWKVPLERKVKEVKKCIVKRDGKIFDLNSRNNTLQDIFSLIETTKKGKEISLNIKEMLDDNGVVVRDLTNHRRKILGLASQTSALYDLTQSPPVIYVSFEDELGLVVHFFAHEAAHAIDSNLFEFYAQDIETLREYNNIYNGLGLDVEPMKDLSEDELKLISGAWEIKEKKIQTNTYKAERHAFDEQGIFTKEVLSVPDCYTDYIKEHRLVNGLKLYTNTPDEHILNSYNLKSEYLEEIFNN